MTNRLVTLVSNDDVRKSVSIKAALLSKTLAGFIEDEVKADDVVEADHSDKYENADPILIPLPNVNGETLSFIASYLEFHVSAHDKTGEAVQTWDNEFKKLGEKDLSDEVVGNPVYQSKMLSVLRGADYLQVRSLVDLMAHVLSARYISNRSLQDIRKVFRLEND